MHDTEAEVELIARAQRGDEAALTELLARHQRALYRFVYRLLGHHADTDDVVQETLVRAFRALPHFDSDGGSLRSWLFTIAARRCATWRSRRARQNEASVALDEMHDVPDRQRSAYEHLISGELGRSLRAAIARLPAQQRVSIVLFEIEGWKVRDIAAALRCAEATVKVHLHRARLRLRRELASYCEEVEPYEMPTCSQTQPRPAER